MIARLPLRLRLTLAYTGVMALVLAATGAFLYLRLQAQLDLALNARLRSESADVAEVVREDAGDAGERDSPLTERGKSYAQLLDASGATVDATPLVRHVALLDRTLLERVRRDGDLTFERPTGPPLDQSLRVHASLLRLGSRGLTTVVGVPLKERNEALGSLATLLLLGGPVALLLASVAGYAIAAAALRPVEAMRRKAAAVSPRQPGGRLPVPPSRDEVARLGVTLNEMLARQEAAFEHERRFVSDASHELRTPLAILKAELDLALHGRRSEDELLAALGSAREETERLSRLAEDLLVIARADQGQLAIRREPVDLGSLLSDMRDRFRRLFEAEGRELSLDVLEPVCLSGDRLRLEQAVGNLLDNALQHGAGTTRLWTSSDGENADIHVEDEGPGFAAAFAPRAFERFAQADQARSEGGSGLGLAIVLAITRAHGGEVHLRGHGRGQADVWLTLPREEPAVTYFPSGPSPFSP